MKSRFTGAIVYNDDIILLAPCESALAITVKVMLVNLTYYLIAVRTIYYILKECLLMLCNQALRIYGSFVYYGSFVREGSSLGPHYFL